MEPDDADGTWRGTIEWDTRFMKPETVHIGYNVTLRYDDGRRIAAPTGNFWLPDTFPEASDGVYFFVAYGPGTPPQESPGVPLLLPLLFVALTLAFLGRRRS